MSRITPILAALGLLALPAAAAAADDGKLRIIVFGAHPDDAEFKAGGTAIKWAKAGHHVKLVSVTNGDIGHWQIRKEPLAKRRKAEVEAAAKVLGVTTQVLDIPDGELEPTLENRKRITKLIRDWQADMVISHRPWDYHPDHRYVGVLVQDAAYMVTVPFITPETKPLKDNPVFLYTSDRFQKPIPFRPDVAVSLDDVFDRKLDAVHELASQVYEGGANGSEAFVAGVPPASDADGRKKWLRQRWEGRQKSEADAHRAGAGQVLRPGPRQRGEVRRDVRGLRVRPTADGGGDEEAVPVLRVTFGGRTWRRSRLCHPEGVNGNSQGWSAAQPLVADNNEAVTPKG